MSNTRELCPPQGNADPTKTTNDGQTALDIATEEKHSPVVQMLKKALAAAEGGAGVTVKIEV